MQKDIQDLTKEELTNPLFIPSIFEEYEDVNERQEILSSILDVASKQRVLGKVKNAITKCNNSLKLVNNNIQAILVLNNQGVPEPTTENYINVMNNDENIVNTIRYNEFTRSVVGVDSNGKERPWTDIDDGQLRCYIEKKYGIYNQQKYYDAVNNIATEHSYHPIKDIIEAEKWDEKNRIDRFLIDILGCPDDVYSREVSRMIFYGGISRLYKPGCKFDYMPIFVGDQGKGKSTIVKWLGLDDYYTDVSSIDGTTGVEVLNGSWICEMGELLAMVRTKEVEAMKGYLTRQTDKYRPAYGRRTITIPRTCIFIGTTNDDEFLVDKTGNRRYLPIKIDSDPEWVFSNQKYVKDYILNCWREALDIYNKGEAYLTIDYLYADIIKEKQNEMSIDDPRVGNIIGYLEEKPIGYKVCSVELFTQCFNGLKKNYSGYTDGKEISRIMKNQIDWKRNPKPYRFPDYGIQKYWEKINPCIKKKKDNFEDLD